MLNLCSHFLQDRLLPANIANRHDSLFVPPFWFSEESQIPRSFCPQHKHPISIVVTRHLDFASQRVPLMLKKRVFLIPSEIWSYSVLSPVPVHPSLFDLHSYGKIVLKTRSLCYYISFSALLCVVSRVKKWKKYWL